MNTPKTDDGTLLKSTDLFAVGLRVRYENMEGLIEENPDYLPDATMGDYASGKIARCCMYRWIVHSGSDGFYPESVLAHGGELFSANDQLWHRCRERTLKTHKSMKPENNIENTAGSDCPAASCSASFAEFPKMARLSRECIITEKIDGTNAQILITEDGQMLVGSRTRWITPEQDNHGFAAWAYAHRDELLKLGTGRHFGEWWGQGIQRKYGMTEKRWSLFNVARWCLHGEEPQRIPTADPRIVKMQDVLPPCCHLVPVLRRGMFSTEMAESALHELRERGSLAAPGFMKPEGIVVFHVAGNVGFKKTLEKDDVPKGQFLR